MVDETEEVDRSCWTVINGQPCALSVDHSGDCQTAEQLVRDAERLLRRVVDLWEYVSSRSIDHEDARAFQLELDAADGQLIEDARVWLSVR